MRKTIWLVVVLALAVLIASPVFAQVTWKDADTAYGQVKKIQVLGASITESEGTGILDVSNLIPAAAEPVTTIDGTTATLSSTTTATIALNGTSATTKVASIKIHYTDIHGAETTGWIQVYSTAS